MKMSSSSQEIIKKAIETAINKYANQDNEIAFTDFHLQPNVDYGCLTIYDDDDNELANVEIPEWDNYELAILQEESKALLEGILAEMKENEFFNKISLLKPYSFVLIDEDKETIEELLLVDDETVLVNNELLKGLDEELDEFLKKLLEED